jgi:iron complex outermembrane receptor protein
MTGDAGRALVVLIAILSAAPLIAQPAPPLAAPVLASVRGIVLDAQTHEPVEGATVRIPELRRQEWTDAGGLFRFAGIPPGSYTIDISRVGYRRSALHTALGGARDTALLYIHLFPVPLEAGAVIVTGEHSNTRIDALSGSRDVLRGKDLQRELGQTLAATLGSEAGLAVRSMGPAPSRPVLRGLGGDRITISEDGRKTNDLSATSPDHAVTVEPFTVERIEVLRGPRVLLRSSVGIGGLVNIVRNDIPPVIPERVAGNAGVYVESANRGVLGAMDMVIPWRSFAARVEASTRHSGDQRTPGGVLANSSADVTNLSAGLSIAGAWGYGGASLRSYASDYGIPGGFVGAHPKGVDVSLLRRQAAAQGRVQLSEDAERNLEFEADRTYFHQTEYEKSGLVGAEFAVTTYSARLAVNTGALGPFSGGSAGISAEARELAVGGYVFTPDTRSRNLSAFVFESVTAGILDLQAAVRLGIDRLDPARDEWSRIGHVRARSFPIVAASVSAMVTPAASMHVGVTACRSARVPTAEELYSEGPHLAAYSYETGNPDLETERGYGLELFAHGHAGPVAVTATVFRNDLSTYIISRNTGTMNFATLLPVYAAAGVPALLWGIEGEAEWKAHRLLSVTASLSHTRGEQRNGGGPLPMVPPMKALLNLRWSPSSVTLAAGLEAAAAQDRVAEFEQPTAGYVIVHASAQYGTVTGAFAHSLSLSVDNLTDREYRNHLSRVKSVMPEAGRSVRLVYRLSW